MNAAGARRMGSQQEDSCYMLGSGNPDWRADENCVDRVFCFDVYVSQVEESDESVVDDAEVYLPSVCFSAICNVFTRV